MSAFVICRRIKASGPGNARNARGYSLMQMIMVVAIVMILAAMAIPSFINSTRDNKLRNDADALTNLIVVGRMRAQTEFERVRINCTLVATSGPGNCLLQSTAFPSTTNWQNEPLNQPQQVFLSSGVTFGAPSGITTNLPNQASTGAYQGDKEQNTPTATNTPVIAFNSRGLPIDYSTGIPGTSDYALYLKNDAGSYMAISVDVTGRPTLYTYANGVFSLMPE